MPTDNRSSQATPPILRKRRGITANAILPVLTNTRATRDLPEDFKQSIWQQQTIKRFAEPADISRPVAFLTSDEGKVCVITGTGLTEPSQSQALVNLAIDRPTINRSNE
jgi:NAD(P)-dependent dehydrogenase (short-subunit alcohol dehydrogenase family)